MLAEQQGHTAYTQHTSSENAAPRHIFVYIAASTVAVIAAMYTKMSLGLFLGCAYPTARQNPANADAKSHIRPQLHTTANKTHKQRVHHFTWTKALQSQRTAATAHAALHTHHSSAKRVLLLRSTHHSSLPSPWIPVASSKQGTRNKRTYKLTTAAPPNTPTQTAHEQHRQHSPSSTAVQSKHTAKNNSSTSCTSHLPQLCKARVAVAGLGCCRLHTICASQCQHLQCSNMHVFTTMQPSRS